MSSISIKSTLASTTCLLPAYEIVKAWPDADFDRYVEAVERWLALRGVNPNAYMKELMRTFGVENKLSVPPGEENDRGNFFVVRKDQDEKLFLIPATSDDIEQARFLVCTGIDTNGKKYLLNSMEALKGVIHDFNKQITLIYHPDAPLKIRTGAYKELLKDHSYFPRGAKRLLDVFSTRRTKPIVYFGHSYGGVNKMFADNADSVSILQGIGVGTANYPREAERISTEIMAIQQTAQKNNGAVVFGAMPLWGMSEQLPTRKKSYDRVKHIEEIKTRLGGPEIFIMAADDILTYLTDYAGKAAMLNASVADKNVFSAYHHPENPNKVFVILAPGLVPTEVNGRINFAGHGLLHYLEVIGLGPKPCGITGELQKVQIAVLRVINNDAVLKQESLATVLGAIPLDKVKLSGLEVDRNPLTAALVAQLVKEGKKWGDMAIARRKNIDPTHPFLRG